MHFILYQLCVDKYTNREPVKNASLSGPTRGGWHCNKVLERCDYVMSNDNGDSPVNAQNVYHFEESLQLSGGGMLR